MDKDDIQKNKRVKYRRPYDGKEYEGMILWVNQKHKMVMIEGGWTPSCHIYIKFKDIIDIF